MPGLVDITGTHPDSFKSIVQCGGLPCAGTLAQVSMAMNIFMKNSLVSVLKMLKAAGVAIDGPVVIAARTGHEDVVSAFLAAGADKDTTNEDDSMPVQLKFGRTAIWVAALNGHEAVVSKLLESGADKNKASKYDDTPLWAAASNGHEAVVSALIDAGADKDKANTYGSTPL